MDTLGEVTSGGGKKTDNGVHNKRSLMDSFIELFKAEPGT